MSSGSDPVPTARQSPSMVVAEHFFGEPLPMGLGQPLALLGGDRLAPDRLPLRLALDWLPDLQAVVSAACARNRATDEPHLSLPPIALVGSAGSGRFHAARRLAREGGLPLHVMHVEGAAGAERLRRSRNAYQAVLPALPISVMAATACANPLILVVGLDESIDETEELLAEMVDPLRNARWVDEALQATIDLSHVNWVIEVKDPASLRRPRASALTHVRVDVPRRADDAEGKLLLLSLVVEAASDLGIAFEDIEPHLFTVLQDIRHFGRSQSRVDALHRATVTILQELDS